MLSQKDLYGNVYVLGSVFRNLQSDIILAKYDSDGNALWSEEIDHHGKDDKGIYLTLRDGHNPIISAAVTDSSGDFDIFIQEFDTSGGSNWIWLKDGGLGLDDVPASLVLDNQGFIYLCGYTEHPSRKHDAYLAKRSTSGTLSWETHFDDNNSEEAGLIIELDGAELFVLGGNPTTQLDTSILVIAFDTSGTYVDDFRDDLLTGQSGYPTWLTTNGERIYICGSNNSQAKILALNYSLDTIWTKAFDFSAGSEIPTKIRCDSSGNVIFCGSEENDAFGSDAFVCLLDTNGNLIWKKNIWSSERNFSSVATDLHYTSDTGILVLCHKKNNYEYSSISAYHTNGSFLWNYNLNHGIDEQAISVSIDSIYHVFAIRKTDSIDFPINSKIALFERNQKTLGGITSQKRVANELILEIDPNYNDSSVIDQLELSFFELGDVFDSGLIDNLNDAYSEIDNFPNAKAIRVFNRRADQSHGINRRGESVQLERLWNFFAFAFEDTIATEANVDLLNEVEGVLGCGYNLIPKFFSSLNDSLYSLQYSLQDTNTYDSAHVNIEAAWAIENGNPNIRVGIYDTGLDYTHEDLGNTKYGEDVGAIVKGGYDYSEGTELNAASRSDLNPQNTAFAFHGTSVAGIIGAQRNNSKGIAGIAGPDDLIPNSGVSLFGFKSTNQFGTPMPMSDIASHIEQGARSVAENGFELNLINFSLGFPGKLLMNGGWPYNPYRHADLNPLARAMKEAKRLGVFFSCSRGQGLVAIDTFAVYPACFPDYLVLNVNASNTKGEHYQAGGVYYGMELDVMAPGHEDIIRTTYWQDVVGKRYRKFDGTSAAAPHVTGVAALVMSQANKNDPFYPYPIDPEDVEQILQLSASDRHQSGYDTLSGHGLLDAGNALELVEYPYYRIQHFSGTNTNHSDLKVIDSLQIHTKNVYAGNIRGSYQGEAYDITYTYPINVLSGDSVLNAWPRIAFCEGMLLENRSSVTVPTQNDAQIVQFNHTQVQLKTRLYKVTHSLGYHSDIPDFWVPAPPDSVSNAFSIHVFDALSNHIDQEDKILKLGFELSPNPSHGLFKLNGLGEAAIEAYSVLDIAGRPIMKQKFDQATKAVSIDLSQYQNGIYLLHWKAIGESHARKLIKAQ